MTDITTEVTVECRECGEELEVKVDEVKRQDRWVTLLSVSVCDKCVEAACKGMMENA